MSIRNLVLNLIKERKILVEKNEYRFLIDQKGGRLDLPQDLTPPGIEPEQHRENFLYADCVLLDKSNKPRMLIEVVSSSPQDLNGIVGLVVNLDRLARFPRGDYSGVDLLFIVLGQIKKYWCSLCKRAHHVSRDSQHFSKAWEAVKDHSPAEILHEGMAMNYRKALLDYPIAPYLRTIRAPSVLFLNSERVMNDWRTYQPTVLSLVTTHIRRRIQDPDRNTNPVFVGVEQLFPETIAKMLAIV